MIARYDLEGEDITSYMAPNKHGEYVRYDEHAARIADLERQLKYEREWRDCTAARNRHHWRSYPEIPKPHSIGIRWRNDPPPYSQTLDWHRECMEAIIDSLTAVGIPAWAGDATECVKQIIEAYAKRSVHPTGAR